MQEAWKLMTHLLRSPSSYNSSSSPGLTLRSSPRTLREQLAEMAFRFRSTLAS